MSLLHNGLLVQKPSALGPWEGAHSTRHSHLSPTTITDIHPRVVHGWFFVFSLVKVMIFIAYTLMKVDINESISLHLYSFISYVVLTDKRCHVALSCLSKDFLLFLI